MTTEANTHLVPGYCPEDSIGNISLNPRNSMGQIILIRISMFQKRKLKHRRIRHLPKTHSCVRARICPQSPSAQQPPTQLKT